jgi:hypothetical protein
MACCCWATLSFAAISPRSRTRSVTVQRYALSDATGVFVERWWNPINTPVLDGWTMIQSGGAITSRGVGDALNMA